MCHDRNCNRFLTLDRLADPFFHIQFTHNFSFLISSCNKDEVALFCNLVYDKILYRYKNKAVLQKEEQLYTYLIYLRALFYRNLINTILMASPLKLC